MVWCARVCSDVLGCVWVRSDEFVLVATRTEAATANCICHRGAKRVGSGAAEPRADEHADCSDGHGEGGRHDGSFILSEPSLGRPTEVRMQMGSGDGGKTEAGWKRRASDEKESNAREHLGSLLDHKRWGNHEGKDHAECDGEEAKNDKPELVRGEKREEGRRT